jgi:hypothetical protein
MEPRHIDPDAIEAVVRARALAAISRAEYLPHAPTIRQKLFLVDLRDEKEAFYGGAAGGGKSDALLMAALEYVDRAGYSALILRRTYKDLSKPGALLDRAHAWLSQTSAKAIDGGKQWRFPSGAVLSFGYLENENDKYQYQSAEYQYIAFDEVTQFSETQYTYLFSRLRRLKGVDIPIRMRAASNPADEPTGYWVADRFVPDDFTPDDAIEPRIFWKESKEGDGPITRRPFVPARKQDNPFLDQEEYERSLAELDDVTRAQLEEGDWRIKRRGNIFPMWNEAWHVVSWSEFAAVYGVRGIPYNWNCGIAQDWGATKSHPCVTTLFTTSAQNSALPGKVFIVWGLTLYEAQNAQQVAREHLIPELERLKVKDRIDRWLMSHEAKSERNSYNEMDLPFEPWGLDSCGGLDQVRRYLEIRNKRLPNPFGKTDRFGQLLYGCPSLMLVVADKELQHARTDAGLARHRAEAAGYSWYVPKAGDAPEKLRPQKLFNDAIDTVRCYAEQEFPDIEPLTANERAEQYVNAHLPVEEVQSLDPEAQVYAQTSRNLHIAERLAEEQKKERSWLQSLDGWDE